MALTQEEKNQLDQAQAIIEQLRSKAMDSDIPDIDKEEIDEDEEFTSIEASSTKKSGSGRY